MAELIRSSSHGNNVSVIRFGERNLIRKVARTGSAIGHLRREKAGWDWYTKAAMIIGPNQCGFMEFENFAILDITASPGRSISYESHLPSTHTYINGAINHYVSVWPTGQIAPCHGDLTLANILFCDEFGVTFIDWEHFNRSGEAWGFDIVYLALSSLLLPNWNSLGFPVRDIDLFSAIWCRLFNLGVESRLIEKPITYFRGSFQAKDAWAQIRSESPQKLFPLVLDPRVADYLESVLIPSVIR